MDTTFYDKPFAINTINRYRDRYIYVGNGIQSFKTFKAQFKEIPNVSRSTVLTLSVVRPDGCPDVKLRFLHHFCELGGSFFSQNVPHANTFSFSL